MACEQSDIQSGVAGGMGWATGELSIMSAESSPQALRRRLQIGDEPLPAELVSLLNILVLSFALVALCFAVEAITVWLWRSKINAKWYAYHGKGSSRLGGLTGWKRAATMQRRTAMMDALKAKNVSEGPGIFELQLDKEPGGRVGLVLSENILLRTKVTIVSVSEGSTFAGRVKAGDVLLAVNGVKVRSAGQGSGLIQQAGALKLRLFRRGKKAKGKKEDPPWFIPFPAALVWPSPLFALLTVFSTGIIKKAVLILVVQPSGCSSACYAISIACCVGIVLSFISVAVYLWDFFALYGDKWKLTPLKEEPEAVKDPLMQIRAMLLVGMKAIMLKARLAVKGPDGALGLSAKDKAVAAPEGWTEAEAALHGKDVLVVLDVRACVSQVLARTNHSDKPPGLTSSAQGKSALAPSGPSASSAGRVMIRTSRPSVLPPIRRESKPVGPRIVPITDSMLPVVRPLPPPPAPLSATTMRVSELISRTHSGDHAAKLRSSPSWITASEEGSRPFADRMLSRTAPCHRLGPIRSDQSQWRRAAAGLSTQTREPSHLAISSATKDLNESQTAPSSTLQILQRTQKPHAPVRATVLAHAPSVSASARSLTSRSTPEAPSAQTATSNGSAVCPRQREPAGASLRAERPTCVEEMLLCTATSGSPSRLSMQIPPRMSTCGAGASASSLLARTTHNVSCVNVASPPPSPPHPHAGPDADVMKLQNSWRKRQSTHLIQRKRSEVAEAAAMTRAATRLQSALRRRYAARSVVQLKASRTVQAAQRRRSQAKQLHVAVVRMQAAWRGHTARRRMESNARGVKKAAFSDEAKGSRLKHPSALKRQVTVDDLKKKPVVTMSDLYSFEREELKKTGHKDRTRVFFDIPKQDYLEPERTGRLLENPWALRRHRAGDSYEQLQMAWIKECNGDKLSGMFMWFLMAMTNVLLAGLSSAGSAITAGSYAGYAQVACIMTLQLGFAVYCFHFTPDSDRIAGSLHGCQFLVEGFSTSLNFAGSAVYKFSEDLQVIDEREQAKNDLFVYAFQLALLAMGVPMLALLEKSLVSPVVGTLLARGMLGTARLVCVEMPTKLVVMLRQFAAEKRSKSRKRASAKHDKKNAYLYRSDFHVYEEGDPRLWRDRALPRKSLTGPGSESRALRIEAGTTAAGQPPKLAVGATPFHGDLDACASRIYSRASASKSSLPAQQQQTDPMADPLKPVRRTVISLSSLPCIKGGMPSRAASTSACTFASANVTDRTHVSAQRRPPMMPPRLERPDAQLSSCAMRLVSRTCTEESPLNTLTQPSAGVPSKPLQRSPRVRRVTPAELPDLRSTILNPMVKNPMPRTPMNNCAAQVISRTGCLSLSPSEISHVRPCDTHESSGRPQTSPRPDVRAAIPVVTNPMRHIPTGSCAARIMARTGSSQSEPLGGQIYETERGTSMHGQQDVLSCSQERISSEWLPRRIRSTDSSMAEERTPSPPRTPERIPPNVPPGQLRTPITTGEVAPSPGFGLSPRDAANPDALTNHPAYTQSETGYLSSRSPTMTEPLHIAEAAPPLPSSVFTMPPAFETFAMPTMEIAEDVKDTRELGGVPRNWG